MVEQTLWASYTPAVTNANDAANYTLGTTFYSTASGWVLGVKWRFPDTLPTGTVSAKLWRIDGDDQLVASGTQLAVANFASPVAGAVNEVRFAAPVVVAANTAYVVSIWTADRYVATTGYGPYQPGAGGIVSGNLRSPEPGTDPLGVGTLHNAKLNPNATHAFPHQSFGTSTYWVDVIFTTDDPVGVNVDSSDAGTGTDAATLAAAVPGTDTGTGAQGQSLAALMASAEAGVVSELQAILATAAASDAGAMVEGWSLVVAHTDIDLGTGTDAQGAPNLSSSDSATMTETQALTVGITSTDSANLIEAAGREVEGAGSEVQQYPIRIVHGVPGVTIKRTPPGITIRG